MIAKFLFSSIRAIENGKEDISSNIKFKDALFITRKADIFAHADMAERCMFRPCNGGFVKKLRKKGEEYFYGESTSCRVKTDDSMLPIYRELMTTGDCYQFEHDIHGNKYTVFCVIPEGFCPSAILSGITWKKVYHSDIYETIKAEYNIAYGLD